MEILRELYLQISRCLVWWLFVRFRFFDAIVDDLPKDVDAFVSQAAFDIDSKMDRTALVYCCAEDVPKMLYICIRRCPDTGNIMRKGALGGWKNVYFQ